MLKKNILLIACVIASIYVAPVISDEQLVGQALLRLFMTEKERDQLDQARKRFLLEVDSGQPMEESINSLNLREIQYGGVVMHGDGRHQIWINGVDISNDKSTRFAPEVMADRSVKLTIGEDKKIRLYPGQIYRFEDGLIQEAYQVARNLVEAVVEEALDEEELVEDDESLDKKQTPIEFDEEELTKQITRIKLLEDRIEELEKLRKAKGLE